MPKAREISKNNQFMSVLSYAFPNLDELSAMAGTTSLENDNDIMSAAKTVMKRMNPTECHLIITMGARGVLLGSKFETKPFQFKAFETSDISVMNCTGAGDTLAGAFIHALLNGCSEEEAIKVGMEKALLSLQCKDRAISPNLL